MQSLIALLYNVSSAEKLSVFVAKKINESFASAFSAERTGRGSHAWTNVQASSHWKKKEDLKTSSLGGGGN